MEVNNDSIMYCVALEDCETADSNTSFIAIVGNTLIHMFKIFRSSGVFNCCNRVTDKNMKLHNLLPFIILCTRNNRYLVLPNVSLILP